MTLTKSLQKNSLYVHEKLQRNPFVERGLKIYIFQPYGFENLEFLTNALKGEIRHGRLDRSMGKVKNSMGLGPQKVQFEEITEYP